MRDALRVGDDPYGIPLMKFTLTYDGDLPSSGNGSKKVSAKWEIRKHFDPQLRELWDVHPALKVLKSRTIIPDGGYWMVEGHHSKDEPKTPTKNSDADIDLLELKNCGGRQFHPLVRESLALVCGLKVLFLRKEKPGKVYQGGDLDNRVKTLLDALTVPQYPEQVIQDDQTINDPIYCLLENDSLISGLSVETERLLSRPNAAESEVRLVIEVELRVTQARVYNSMLLGS